MAYLLVFVAGLMALPLSLLAAEYLGMGRWKRPLCRIVGHSAPFLGGVYWWCPRCGLKLAAPKDPSHD